MPKFALKSVHTAAANHCTALLVLELKILSNKAVRGLQHS